MDMQQAITAKRMSAPTEPTPLSAADQSMQRFCDFLVEELPERAMRGINAADDLLHVETDRHRVVAVLRPRSPRRLLSCEQAGDQIEGAHFHDRQLLVEQNEHSLVPTSWRTVIELESFHQKLLV